MAVTPALPLLERELQVNSGDSDPSTTTFSDNEVETLVIRALRKLADAFSEVGDEIEPLSATDYGVVAMPSTAEADFTSGTSEDPGHSTGELGADTARDPSAESSEDPSDDPSTFFKTEPSPSTPLQCLQNELAASFNSAVLKEFREHLDANDCIRRESRLFGEPIINDTFIKFWLSPEGYNEWIQTHQAEISTNFVTMKGSYKFVSKKRKGNEHIYLVCQRAGQKREIKGRVPGGKSGKTRVRKASMKMGCPAKLQVVTQKRPGPNGALQSVYEITYIYQHNHGLGCFSSLGTKQKSEAIKATIRKLILSGSTISMVMRQLTMEYDKFTQVLRQKGRLSRDDSITYDDIYNIWHSILVSKMRKDEDPVISSIMWMEELEKDGAFTYYDKGDRIGGLYFGFSTTWQMNQLKAYGQTVCFDGTHNVFGQKINLFTLVVKNTTTGFGVPVAFLLTTTTESDVLVAWLRGLRSKMTTLFSSPDQDYVYKPSTVITDQSNTEILAINRAFAGESVLIFFCAWHVYRAWETQVRTRIHGISKLPPGLRKVIEDTAVSDLRSILQEQDIQKALQNIQQYREKWGSQYQQHDLLKYLNNNYFGPPDDRLSAINIQKHWMTCYRQGVSYSNIDANSYIGSWHNILKRHFFRDRHQRRPDTVIYFLAFMALPHFQQKFNRTITQAGRMTPSQKIEERFRSVAKKQLETRESIGFLGDPLVQIDSNTLQVESFTTPKKWYDIQVALAETGIREIISCSCEYFSMHRSCCKHIALTLERIPQMRPKCTELDLHEINKRKALEAAQSDYNALVVNNPLPRASSFYVERVRQLHARKGDKTPWRHQEQIDSLFAQLIHLMQDEMNGDMPVKKQKRQY